MSEQWTELKWGFLEKRSGQSCFKQLDRKQKSSQAPEKLQELICWQTQNDRTQVFSLQRFCVCINTFITNINEDRNDLWSSLDIYIISKWTQCESLSSGLSYLLRDSLSSSYILWSYTGNTDTPEVNEHTELPPLPDRPQSECYSWGFTLTQWLSFVIAHECRLWNTTSF